MAQSFKRPTLAPVMISQFMGSSPSSGSVLTSQSLEPASDSASLPLSLPLPHLLSVSVSQKGIKTLKKILPTTGEFGSSIQAPYKYDNVEYVSVYKAQTMRKEMG